MGNDRFYLPHYADQPDREVLWADVGNHLKITGLVFQGMGSTLVLLSPSGTLPGKGQLMPAFPGPVMLGELPGVMIRPTVEEWGEILRRSDDPEEFIGEAGGINKILHRKMRSAISGAVQQKVWARDGFKCVYCGAKMGEVPLTIDHFVPLESGGINEERNYVSACRRCNKAKGMMLPEDFCKRHGFDYERIRTCLENIYGNGRKSIVQPE